MSDQPAPPPRDRTLTWWPLIGAALIAAVFLVVIFVSGAGKDNRVGTKTDGDGALTCPDTYKQRGTAFWVPLEPSGVDGEARLLPPAPPGHLTLCRYRLAPTAGRSANVSLDGSRVLSAGVRTAGRRLSGAPEAAAGTRAGRVEPGADIYLLGMTYATGVVWISAPVDTASNGSFVTSADVHDEAARAFESGTWPSS